MIKTVKERIRYKIMRQEYYSDIPADVERSIHYQRKEKENIGKYLALILRHKP